MKLISVSAVVLAVLGAVNAKPIVYLIRHGEKPANGDTGLNPAGVERSQCLVNVFGAKSQYNIGHIMAQKYKSDGSRARPYLTVLPLAVSLGQTVDISCDRDDAACVAKVVKNYKGSGNILIAWEHDALTDIVDELGAGSKAPKYPSENFGLIWTDPSPYTAITSITNENCPGLGK